MKYFEIIVLGICLSIILFIDATEVKQCKNGKSPKLESDDVKISGCEKGVCKLRKGRNVNITMTVIPKEDVPKIITSASAIISSIPVPYFGIDGTSACDNMYDSNNNKTGCPLKAGETYFYKNSFPVLKQFPNLKLEVYWALVYGDKVLACFLLPSSIE